MKRKYSIYKDIGIIGLLGAVLLSLIIIAYTYYCNTQYNYIYKCNKIYIDSNTEFIIYKFDTIKNRKIINVYLKKK